VNHTGLLFEKMKSIQYLPSYTFELIFAEWGHWVACMRWSILEVLIKVLAKELKDQYHVSSERERIDHSYDSCLISRIMLLNSGKYTILDLAVVKVELFVSTDFDCDFTAGVLDVEAFDHLSEGSFVDNLCNKVSISYMFSYTGSIIAFRICTFSDTLPAVTTHSINIFKVLQF